MIRVYLLDDHELVRRGTRELLESQGDIVVVGDSPQRRLFRDFLTVAPLLASPLVTILQ